MSDLTVRWATRWDRKAIIEMLAALARQHDTPTDPDALSAAFDFALGAPDRVRFIVVQRGQDILGMASLHEGYSTWQAAPYGLVHDVYVKPDHRGQGLGTALMELVADEGRRRGFCRLELCVQEDNEDAIGFYEALKYYFTGYLVYAKDLTETAEE
jgi:ribosomal protein S18 acetylase RimI-like enzyme